MLNTVLDYLIGASEKHRDKSAIVYEEKQLTYGELQTQAFQTAG